jgi:hypothetical protein
MPGPALTMTDVEQLMKDFELESHIWAREELKQGCLAIYAQEREAGTDRPAIIGRLREHVEQGELNSAKNNKHNGGRQVKKRRRHESSASYRAPTAKGPRSENLSIGFAGRKGEPIDCPQRPIRNGTCIVSMSSKMTRMGI